MIEDDVLLAWLEVLELHRLSRREICREMKISDERLSRLRLLRYRRWAEDQATTHDR